MFGKSLEDDALVNNLIIRITGKDFEFNLFIFLFNPFRHSIIMVVLFQGFTIILVNSEWWRDSLFRMAHRIENPACPPWWES
jgi:hypothetical protein